ncbi:hypothetical protein HK101_007343, partial [Irineochytrium annulatum]
MFYPVGSMTSLSVSAVTTSATATDSATDAPAATDAAEPALDPEQDMLQTIVDLELTPDHLANPFVSLFFPNS